MTAEAHDIVECEGQSLRRRISGAEDAQLIDLIKRGNKGAAEKLLVRHEAMIKGCARRFAHYSSGTWKLTDDYGNLLLKEPLAYRDLVQVASMALLDAAKTYRRELGDFAPLAKTAIVRRIKDYVFRDASVLTWGRSNRERDLYFGLGSLKTKLGIADNAMIADEDIEAIAEQQHIAPEHLRELEIRAAQPEVSLDNPISDEDDGATLMDCIPGQEIAHDLRLEDRDWVRHLKERSALTPNEEWVVNMLICGDSTAQQLADSRGICVQRVHQIKTSALKKLGRTHSREEADIKRIDGALPSARASRPSLRVISGATLWTAEGREALDRDRQAVLIVESKEATRGASLPADMQHKRWAA